MNRIELVHCPRTGFDCPFTDGCKTVRICRQTDRPTDELNNGRKIKMNEMQMQSRIEDATEELCETIERLRAALRATTAYVELHTGHGVREQPPARYILPNGEFNAEDIARDARAALNEGDKDNARGEVHRWCDATQKVCAYTPQCGEQCSNRPLPYEGKPE